MKTYIVLAAFLFVSFLVLKANEKQGIEKIANFTEGAFEVTAIFCKKEIVHHSGLYFSNADLVRDTRLWIRESDNNRVKIKVGEGEELDIGYREIDRRMYYIYSLPKTDYE